jgi:S1-C subfamily serine protease
MIGMISWLMMLLDVLSIPGGRATVDDSLNEAQMAAVRRLEGQRIEAIEKVRACVISIYGDRRQGGGSGVIVDPSGIGLTNHHVIMGAGVRGWGGLADGQLYAWELIGTDPGGDVAVIQLTGKDSFPSAPLGDSDSVQVGDWVLAMGNPFLLAEDQTPTVTLGIVSGVRRFQPGAGMNQLVYGNCIQTDSSINPGNSGGPLFNIRGEVIGINGRGSFEERGRVNVGLGYAISANQIKNFLPDLLATKLVEHGTLDANFEDRGGKVVCSNVYEDSDLYRQGIRPGDELLEFEGEAIESANHFMNLICTLPEDWPAQLKVRQSSGKVIDVATRLYGLPYPQPRVQPQSPQQPQPSPEDQEQLELVKAMIELLSAQPGTIRMEDVNRRYARLVFERWANRGQELSDSDSRMWRMRDEILRRGEKVGEQQIWIGEDGRLAWTSEIDGVPTSYAWDGKRLYAKSGDRVGMVDELEMTRSATALQALAIAVANRLTPIDFERLVLHGGDKALAKPCFRLKWQFSEQVGLYFWLQVARALDSDSIELLKIAVDRDGEGEVGAISTRDWVEESGLKYPRRREMFSGLREEPILSWRTSEFGQRSPQEAQAWREEMRQMIKSLEMNEAGNDE